MCAARNARSRTISLAAAHAYARLTPARRAADTDYKTRSFSFRAESQKEINRWPRACSRRTSYRGFVLREAVQVVISHAPFIVVLSSQ